MADKKGSEEDFQALKNIFEIYWKEELREAEEAVKKEGEKPIPPMSEKLRRKVRWLEGRVRKVVLFVGKVCAVLIFAFAILFAINKDVRAWTIGFIREIYEEYVNFSTETHVQEGEVEIIRHELGYVPEGYELLRDEVNEHVGHIIYINAENKNRFLYLKYMINFDLSFANADSTNMVWTEVFLPDGTTAEYGKSILPEKIEHNYLIWVKDEYLFELAGEFEQEEMLHIAEEIKKLEQK